MQCLIPNQAKPLPQYQGMKQVRALKIKEVICHAHQDPAVSVAEFAKTAAFQGAHLMPEDTSYFPIAVDADWFRKHNPEKGGYLVIFEDDYATYSSAEAFARGYAPC